MYFLSDGIAEVWTRDARANLPGAVSCLLHGCGFRLVLMSKATAEALGCVHRQEEDQHIPPLDEVGLFGIPSRKCGNTWVQSPQEVNCWQLLWRAGVSDR